MRTRISVCQPIVLLLTIAAVGVLGLRASDRLPEVSTPKRPVTTEYHGVKVTEDYRWLEDAKDPEVQKWSEAQNQRTRQYLDALPSRPAIKQRVAQLVGGSSASYYNAQYRGGTLFLIKRDPGKQQPFLVAMKSADDPASERAIADPNAMAEKGLSIDFYSPSLDGKKVAVAMSPNGSEDAAAYLFDAETGLQLADRIPRVNFATAGGSVAWTEDGTGFYYTRYPQGQERAPEDANFYQQVYFHKLGGAPSADTYVIGKDFPRIAEIQLDTVHGNGKYLLASVANGDGGEFEYFIMDSTGKWTQLTHFADQVVAAVVGPNDDVYLLSRKGAPRGKVLRMEVSNPSLAKAQVVVPESETSIEDYGSSSTAANSTIVPTANRLYVVGLDGGPSLVRIFDHSGKQLGTLPLPKISSAHEVVPATGEDVLFLSSTYLIPPAWYRFDAASGKAQKTALFVTSPAKFDDAEVVREFATSKDGTRLPLNIIRRKGTKLDGSNPTLLTGYGGFGVSESPGFAGATGRIWLDQGGVYVIANLRGGGEYGESWHQAGKLTKKQNVFDDFAAAAQHLIKAGYTTPQKLAIRGGSNGGLLMGAALTQHPELYRVVVSHVGIYDMLRTELDPNGVFNATEYGTVKDPAQFKALYAYSPYHHVKDGTAYPSILFLTGANDGRVNPAHSRKMIARLQAANAGDHPILLRTSSNTGHGFGTSTGEMIEQSTDVFSFLFDQLGIKFKTMY